MPTISCNIDDLNALAGSNLSPEELDNKAVLFKGECKDFDPETREIKIELQDTNRPDLWCVEGIARQLKCKLSGTRTEYPWFNGSIPPERMMMIDPAMESIRPYAAGFAVHDVDVTEEILIASIQTQEKLTDNLGRHRKSVSVGIYDLNQIIFPVHYCAVGRDDVSFVPLAFDHPMTPKEVLSTHPKGMEYRHILEGFDKVPMLMDAQKNILSFPPIINSRLSGEVKVGRRDLFIETTGTNMHHILLALNIFAVNLADRGGRIEPLMVRYPYDTPLGRDIQVPYCFDQTMRLDIPHVKQWLGCDFAVPQAQKLLEEYGYETSLEADTILATMPSWRNDLLHQVDLIEDLAISAGYESFVPEMPKRYTVGNLAPLTRFTDLIRDIALGFGCEEIISNILCNVDEFSALVREPNRRLVEIKNPMTTKFGALRDRVLPSLLRVERDSSGASFPHRIFEVGEVTIHDDNSDTHCKTVNRLSLLVSDRTAEFAAVHSYLEILLYNLDLECSLISEDHPLFIPGRSGNIVIDGICVGIIGEIHPETLENFEITMPCAAFEIDLNMLSQMSD
jgi:phenylalanyl-tRNA synthetase beta chain